MITLTTKGQKAKYSQNQKLAMIKTSKEKNEYPYCCDVCENQGMYTCKRILNTDNTCMFFKEMEKDESE